MRPQGRSCAFAELAACRDRAVIGKADQSTVERCVPKGREQETVMHIGALRTSRRLLEQILESCRGLEWVTVSDDMALFG
jgi:hypothetical protein